MAPFTVAPPRYQLPAALRLGPVHLQVSSLERSVVYYEQVMGLRVLQRTPNSATMGARGSDSALLGLHELQGARPVLAGGRLGLYHFALVLPTRAALGEFLAHLRQLGQRAGMSDHLVSEAIYLSDPDGLGIEVYADRPRESWQLDGAAIVMATNPLDVAGVLAAARGGRWTGAPAGTRIGHVHLYVDSLQESARFFHEGLGLDRVTLQFPGALFLSAGGYHHHLGTNTWAAGAPLATNDDARLLEWTVVLPLPEDVADVARSLEAGAHSVRWDGSDVIARDPWGADVRIRPEGCLASALPFFAPLVGGEATPHFAIRCRTAGIREG